MGVLLNATVMKLPLIVLAWSTQAEAHEIEHVVVAMLENRAFDHMLGYYNRIDPRIDGLRGDECNVRNLTDRRRARNASTTRHSTTARTTRTTPLVRCRPSNSGP